MAPKAEKKPAAKKPAEEPAAETAPTGKKSRAEKRLPAGKSTGKEGDLNDGYAGDIWSFGLSILEFYLDRFPLGENLGKQGDWAALMCAICYSDSPQAPRNASPDFKNFISLCLQKNPASRPSAMRLLQHPFVNPPQPQPQPQPQPLAATDSPQFRPIDY